MNGVYHEYDSCEEKYLESWVILKMWKYKNW